MRKLPVLLCAIFVMVFIAACASNDWKPSKQITSVTPAPTIAAKEIETTDFGPLTWNSKFVAPPCRADANTPLFDKALEHAGLPRSGFGFSERDLFTSPDFATGRLTSEFLLPWFEKLRQNPRRAGCFEGEVIGALDYYMKGDHPVSSSILHAAVLLDPSLDKQYSQYPQNHSLSPGSFDDALKALCETAGGCTKPSGEMPPELSKALTPIIWALIDGINARQKMDTETTQSHNPEWWWKHGENLIPPSASPEKPDLQNDQDRAYLLGIGGRRDLYRAAARIAHAVEETRWSPFSGLTGVNYSLRTEAGWIIIRDASDHIYEDNREDVLLLLDLGGNDEHREPVASNTSWKNPVSVAIDLQGSEKYGYDPYRTPYDKEGLIPADRYGRYRGDEKYGNISLSEEYRQAAARNGIAMLFDFGKEDDSFQSLRCSQACAYLGVAVLFVEGGNNKFFSEAFSQGAAQFGIALHITAGSGNDIRGAFTQSQGFGFVGGLGLVWDGGGNDVNICDLGDPERKGIPLYFTPQLPGKGNSSFCQGAGLGIRGHVGIEEGPAEGGSKDFLAGGIGIHRDLGGNNSFSSSVFGLGTGYWQGTGLLSISGKGDNKFNVVWYGLGAAAHHGVGMFFRSGEGNDSFNGAPGTHVVALGAGVDFSVGIFVNDNRGKTYYHVAGLSAGASQCNGIGLFVHNEGQANITASKTNGSGMGNIKCTCERPTYTQYGNSNMIKGCAEIRLPVKSAGIMLVVGENIYEYPQSEFPMPGKNKMWGYKLNSLSNEYGAGLDAAEGETGIHAESARVK